MSNAPLFGYGVFGETFEIFSGGGGGMNKTGIFQACEHTWLRGRYESCWQAYRSSPHESVDAFLQELPKFGRYGIGLLKGEFLRVRTRDLFSRGASTAYFTDMNLIGLVRLRNACWSHGHLSVIFVSEQPEELVTHYLSLGFYRRKGLTVHLGSGESSDSIGLHQAELLYGMVTSHHLRAYKKIFAFSHNADYFYEIFLE